MSWYCKKDVLNDIAHVTGNSVKELDEQYIVVGEQPPPVRTTNEVNDDEFLLRYGGLGSQSSAGKGQNPDLAGITEMLRMVDKFQNPLNELSDKKEEKDCCDTIVSITKLNPNVSEFIPKNTLQSNSCELDKTRIKVADSDSSYNKDEYEKSEISSDRLDVAGLKDISDKLKQKISSPSVETCLQKKTERNLAIASLLKLYSDKPAISEITENKLKLITPQHFDRFCLNKKTNTNDSQTSSQNLFKQEDTENITEDTKYSNKLIKESVLKVQNWLEKESKGSFKEPALYLGPITFKKKENIKRTTPSSDNSDKVYKKVESFTPSEYANKLTETYMIRNKTNNDHNGCIWTKLERELKARDDIIKGKMKLQAENAYCSTD